MRLLGTLRWDKCILCLEDKGGTVVPQICSYPNSQNLKIYCITWQRDFANVIKVANLREISLNYLGGQSLITQTLKAEEVLQLKSKNWTHCIRGSRRDPMPEADSTYHGQPWIWRSQEYQPQNYKEQNSLNCLNEPEVDSSPDPCQVTNDTGLLRS